jgi:hypothetical protein
MYRIQGLFAKLSCAHADVNFSGNSLLEFKRHSIQSIVSKNYQFNHQKVNTLLHAYDYNVTLYSVSANKLIIEYMDFINGCLK